MKVPATWVRLLSDRIVFNPSGKRMALIIESRYIILRVCLAVPLTDRCLPRRCTSYLRCSMGRTTGMH